MFRTTRNRPQGSRQENQSSFLPTTNYGLRTVEDGFTLAALLVILTIMSIIIAYTVPMQWSLVLRRERERQTIYLMKQYAMGVANWERKHQALPVSLQQLQDARQPRMLRGTGKWANPLTGQENDWILVPPNAIEVGAGPSRLNPAASPKDYVGPFVAVRPNARGKSLIALNGADDYSQWVYTLQDLKNERMMRRMAMVSARSGAAP